MLTHDAQLPTICYPPCAQHKPCIQLVFNMLVDQ